jgi:hypothetical protein
LLKNISGPPRAGAGSEALFQRFFFARARARARARRSCQEFAAARAASAGQALEFRFWRLAL